jgi:tetratricopeptide (TPR) repeat protein
MSELTTNNAHKNSSMDNTGNSIFHRIDLEYYSLIKDLKLEQVFRLLSEGFRHNLELANFNPDSVKHIHSLLKKEATAIIQQKDMLNQYFEENNNSLNTKQQVGEDTHEALIKYLSTPKPRNHRRLQQIKELFQKAIASDPENYLALFDFGWLYFHLQGNLDKAHQYFSDAVNQCLIQNSPFKTLAMRYLAETAYRQGKSDTALKTMYEVTTNINDSQCHYDYARYLLAANKKTETMVYLSRAIMSSPARYLEAQSDPCFETSPSIAKLLTSLHTKKLSHISMKVAQEWENNPLSKLNLQDEFDTQQIYQTMMQQHEDVLKHQPYPLLCKEDAIIKKASENLTNTVLKKLQKLNDSYTNEIHIKRIKWRIINSIGITFLYFSVILTFASILLFVGHDMIGLAVDSNEILIDWSNLTGKIIGGIFLSALIGYALIQIESPGSKALLKKKEHIHQIINKLENSAKQQPIIP